MKIAIMQPYLFPYIGYFQLINSVDKFIIFDDVNFIKKGWINRNKILNNDKEYIFTLPVKKISQNRPINTFYISEANVWKKNFLRIIENFYKKAEFFFTVFELIHEIVEYDEEKLSKYIYNSIVRICEFLEINTDLIETSAEYKNRGLKSQKRIIDICLLENADYYFNLIGGKNIYNKKDFLNNGIELSFLKTQLNEYKQFKNSFVPSLSIIDVMMFNNKKEIKKMLNSYELI